MKLRARVRRAVATWVAKKLTLSGVDSARGWTTLFRSDDTYTGSWQQDAEISREGALAFAPVYACLTLIAGDIGKVCLRLMSQEQKVWVESESSAFSPLLRRPNHYQTRQQFIECWVLSKLLNGNAYILKVRDDRNVVKALYVLDPNRVMPLVSPDGSIFYELRRDDLSQLPVDYPAVPAREIIHDRMECLFHPLVGISPLYAAHLASSQGLRIQRNSERFFRNMSRPGGMLTAPATISDEVANRLKAEFEKNYSGTKVGRLFVSGDGIEFKSLAQTAEDSQLVEQLKLTAEQVCTAFHVPAYMIGVGPAPSYANVEALNQHYYTQCLQKLFNAIEDLLDDALALRTSGYRTEFDLEDLLRMDTATRIKSTNDQVGGGWLAPDEARARFGMLPVPGGSQPYMQQQMWQIGQLDGRAPPQDAPAQGDADGDESDDEEKAIVYPHAIRSFATSVLRSQLGMTPQ